MARRHVEGQEDVRKILRGLPDASRDEIVSTLEASADEIRPIMVERAPRRSGDLQSGILSRVNRQSMTARIGLIGPPKQRRSLFYGRILDLGRRAQDRWVTRRMPSGNRSRYLMRISAIAPKKFVTGRFPEARATLQDKLRGVWGRILARITGAQ